MADETKIKWADKTHNEWIGCDKVAPECRVCYAETMNKHRKWMHVINSDGEKVGAWGKGIPRYLTTPNNRNKPYRWDRKAKELGIKYRVFSDSLADWLDDEVPIEWLEGFLTTVTRTPNLTWLLLSKRYQDWESRFDLLLTSMKRVPENRDVRLMINRWIDGNPPANVHIGMTAGSKQMAAMIPTFVEIPALARFLSIEPLLEDNVPESLNGVHEIIVGGENDSTAKPMHPGWVRKWFTLADKSRAAKFFKQHGTWIEEEQARKARVQIRAGSDFGTLDINGDFTPGVRPSPAFAMAGAVVVHKLGVEHTGDKFDGKLWEDVVQPIAWEPTEPGLNVMATSLVAGHFVDKHPESGWVLYSRGEGSQWEQRTARAFAPSKQHLPSKEGGIWRWKFIEED